MLKNFINNYDICDVLDYMVGYLIGFRDSYLKGHDDAIKDYKNKILESELKEDK